MILGDGMLNIPGLNGVFVIPSLYLGFYCAIVVSRSCHRLAGVGIDLNFGRVHVCRYESHGFDETVRPVIVGCRMAPGPVARDGRWPWMMTEEDG